VLAERAAAVVRHLASLGTAKTLFTDTPPLLADQTEACRVKKLAQIIDVTD